MTSANVTNYRIERNGEIVGEHSQHHMCHTHWHRLYKYTPFTEYKITPHWEDEHEAPHEGKTVGLSEFLANHKPSISDMKRMMGYIEQQNEILKEWLDKFGDSDKELSLRTRNKISYSPL
jgi:hypothetical protein